MLDTYQSIYNKLQLRAPAVSSLLARDWVDHAFRQIAEQRRWSWKVKYGEFLFPALTATGTVTVTHNSNVVVGIGTSWNATLIGQQFRVSSSTPIYTVTAVPDSTHLEIDLPWGGDSVSSIGYQIYLAYATPPADFQSLITVWDPAYNWQLWLNIQQQEINAFDAQRSNVGPSSYLVSFRDYSTTYAGFISDVLEVIGSSTPPISTSQGQGYTGVNNCVFSLQVINGGAPNTAVFQWRKDNSASTVATTSDTPQDLSDGVQVYWPAAVSTGDVFIIQCSANLQGGLPRYEFWPHKQAQYVYPFLYECRPPDLSDPGATLPRYIRGDVLLEMSLEQAARWPGLEGKPNPYFNLVLADRHRDYANKMIYELERQDDETSEIDAKYQYYTNLTFCPYPFADSHWLQSHAV